MAKSSKFFMTVQELKKELDFAIESQKYYLQQSGKYSSLATLSQRGAQVATDAYIDSLKCDVTIEQQAIILGAFDSFEQDAVKHLRNAGVYSKDAYSTASDKVRAARLALELHIESRESVQEEVESQVNTNPTEAKTQDHIDTFGY
jgi:hypothetical protein